MGNFLQTFLDNLSVPSSKVENGSLTFEDGIDSLSRNNGNPEEPSSHLFGDGSVKLRIYGRISDNIKADMKILLVNVS
jgi:hypothetical protein